MNAPHDQQPVLQTAAGAVPLHEYRLHAAGRAWTILHTSAVLTPADEVHTVRELAQLPYGVALWPSAIALAHDVATREDAFKNRSILELGAGTGLPGIIAASLGGRVVQTDRMDLALSLCQRNGARNDVSTIAYRVADWITWQDADRYDWILGADILYGESLHPHLLKIFSSNLTPQGKILLADPFRAVSLQILEAMEADGWTITMSKWSVGEAESARPVGVFELVPPR